MAEERENISVSAEAYRSALAFGQKKQAEQLGLVEENARLRQENERLAVDLMKVTMAGAQLYEENERLRAALTRIVTLGKEAKAQGVWEWCQFCDSSTAAHETTCAWVACSALAGTEHRQARSLGDQALGVCATDGESWPCALAGTEARDA